ncbi:MAG: SWIM zinc finger family protein, partial [Spirochaetia bacterium]|nr:SWIM zinc finger family protein [Spirochaetia bacterium]
MAVIQFGHTWWGKKWLESLTRIDYTNRLPRGQRYARNGSVVSIDIQKGKISAKVAGRRRTPYNVRLNPWSFTEKGKKIAEDLILRNPYYLSQLEARVLPRELLEEFSNLGMPLFPASWKELPMRCSCPDWAVPCKHIAAVIYIIANEIDKDPFLVFTLHGFDLIKSIEDTLYADQPAAENVPLLPSFCSGEELNCSCSQSALESIDFSSIPDIGDAAAGILTEKPLFYPKKDFKALLTASADKLSKAIQKKVKEIDLAEEPPELLFTSGEFKLLHGKKLVSAVLKQGKQRISFSSEDPEPFISSIGQLPAVNLSAYPPLTAYLVMLHSFTLKLMEQRALIPDLYGVSEGKYRIRWIPALFNTDISAIFTSLAEQLPSSLVSFKGTPLDRREQLFMIISFIANSYINESDLLPEKDADPIISMFFSGSIYTPSRFEERGNIQAIQLWLGRFFIRPSKLVPILHIEELTPDDKGKGKESAEAKDDYSYRFEIHVENTASADASAAENAELDEAASGGAASDGAAAGKQSAQKRLTPSTAAGTASSSASASPQPLFSIISELDAESMALLRDLQLLAAYLPAVNTYLKAGKAVTIDEEDFAESWFAALGALQTLGVRTHVPKALQKRLFPQLTLSFKKKAGVSSESVTNYLSLQKLVDFQWSIAAGDMLIPADEFYELTSTYKKLIRYHDAYVMLDEKELKKMRKALEKPVSLRPLDIVKIHLEGSYNNVPIQTDASLKSIINSLFTVDPVPLPDRLQADLRPYQEKGFQWLYHNHRIGIGSLIADDMGLGKTLQVLALLQKMKEEGSLTPKKAAIVIVPASLATNWQKEMEKFTPDLIPGIYHGQNRMLDPECEVIITTYSVVSQDTSLLSKKKWSAVIIDEAQNIKTPTAARTAAVKSLKGEVKIAMTGTPVENRLMDYWSVFDFMMKNLLG